MDTRTRKWIAFLILSTALLTGCARQPTASTASPTPTAPSASLLTAPDTVCGTATQVRLQVQVSRNLSAEDPGVWDLFGPGDAPVAEGNWIVRDGTVLVPFPNNAPLPAGPYTLRLRWKETELATHSFSIGPAHPTLEVLEISAVPGGVPVSTLWVEAPLRLFYINYAFEGGCTGVPYWITTLDAAGETVCAHNGVLDSMDGAGVAACYDENERPFALGQYETTMTLPDDITRTVSFEIAFTEPTATPPPAPTQTPRPPEVSCEPNFAAAGLTPEGEPYLPLSVFDWYTQAIYTGRVCRNLQPGTLWRSTWFRDGALVRENQGLWEGPSAGAVWDVLTGVPANPFVPPGTYTVTLEIAGDTAEARFTVFDYPTTNSTD